METTKNCLGPYAVIDRKLWHTANTLCGYTYCSTWEEVTNWLNDVPVPYHKRLLVVERTGAQLLEWSVSEWKQLWMRE